MVIILFAALSIVINLGVHFYLKRNFKNSLPMQQWLLSLVLICLGIYGREFALSKVDKHFSDLLEGFASTYAISMKGLEIESINLNTKENDANYIRLIEAQKNWVNTNNAVADVYTFTKNSNGKITLLVDSETDYDRNGIYEGDKESRTKIGEIYDHDIETLNKVFDTGKTIFQKNPVQDRWGTWISVYTPIPSTDKKVKIVTGVDFPARDYVEQKASMEIGVFFLLFVFLAISLFTIVVLRKETNYHSKELELQNELHRFRVQSEIAGKLAALGEMAGGVAHEINNPLCIIRLKASQLKRLFQNQTLEKGQAEDFLQNIEDHTVRMSKIVEGLKSFSRSDVGIGFETVELSKIMEEVKNLCSERLKKHGVHLEILYPKDLKFSCMFTKVEQILVNLVNNSFDAICETKNPWIRCEAKIVGKMLELAVIDSGHGIPESVASQMMQPFFTTKPIGKGTGLGLSISFGIAKEHGGSLYLDRNCKNTKFVLSIPLKQADKLSSITKTAA